MKILFFNYFIKKKKRIGRGISSGQGKTCGKGHKGQKSRSGFNLPKMFEGGQTKIFKSKPKVTKKKFFLKNKKFYNIIYESKKFY